MNIILTTIVVVLGIGLVIYLFAPRKKVVEKGFFHDLPNKFNVLLNSKPKVSTIIVAISGTEDFIQFSFDDEKVEMDYPVITPRQKELSPKFREICSQSGYQVREITGSDGAKFLDISVSSDSEDLVIISKRILTNLFGAKDDTKLKFTFLP